MSSYSTSLGEWLRGVTGVTDMSPRGVAEAVGAPPEAYDAISSCSTEELEALLLYFVVKNKSFDTSKLSNRELLFIVAVQRDIANLHKTLELSQNWHRLWKIT
jgi:hypothetical protein